MRLSINARRWDRPARPDFVVALLAMVIAVGLAVLIGASVVLAPLAITLAFAALVSAWLGLRLPLWVFAALAIAAAGASSVARLGLFDAGVAKGTVNMLSQGRVLGALAAFTAARFIVSRQSLVLPRGPILIVGLFLTSIVFAGIVGITRASAPPDLFDNVVREIARVGGGFAVGIMAMSYARSTGAVVSLLRSLAVVTIAAGALSLIYWAWLSGWFVALPPFQGLFETVREGTPTAVGRVRFPFVDNHPNGVAEVYAGLAAFTVPSLLATTVRADRTLAVLTMLAAAGAILATQSRTGIVVFALAIMVYLVATRGISRRARLTASLAAVGIAAVIVFAQAQLPEDRALTLDTENFRSRQELWAGGLDEFASSPIVGQGHGYSVFGSIVRTSGPVHSEYLGRLTDGGIVGFGAFALVLGTFGIVGWQLYLSDDRALSALGIGTLAYLAVLLTAMAVQQSWTGSAITQIESWLFFGIAAAAGASASATRPAAEPRGPAATSAFRRPAQQLRGGR